MTNEEVERAIEFLLHHHAKVSADIQQHSEQIVQLTQSVAGLTKDVQALTGNVDALTVNVEVMRAEMDANRADLGRAIDNLIVANEVTRKLAEDVARLNVGMSQRVTRLESRVDDLEPKG
jgi:ABC-type transporter Mla subunit MlaD